MTPSKHDVPATLRWMRDGTQHLLAVVASLPDNRFGSPSRLPGWTKAHVIGHVARNAEALARLATWARTGVETPMYADRDQRAAEIEESAGHPPQALRASLVSTAGLLDAELGRLGPVEWAATVKSALGRHIPAAEIPWMRMREVWLHAVDLGDEALLNDIPHDVLDLLLDDVCATLTTKDECPAVLLSPADRRTSWRIGTTEPQRITILPAAVLVGWLTGRAERPDLPVLPRWL